MTSFHTEGPTTSQPHRLTVDRLSRPLIQSLLVIIVLSLVGTSASAQGPNRGTRTADSVRRLPHTSRHSLAYSDVELTFDWAATIGTPGSAARRGAQPEVHQFQMRGRRPVGDRPQRERNPQIGPDDLVIVAVDPQGTEVSWQRMKDPRILRAELPDENGLLSGETFYRTDTELVITVPDAAPAAFLDVYEAVQTPSDVRLRSLTRITLR